jgi:DNA uptake protein ComE-like DNA-binding protein
MATSAAALTRPSSPPSSAQGETLNSAWAVLPVASLGLLSWGPFLYIAVKTGSARYRLISATYLAVAMVAAVLLALQPSGDGGMTVLAGMLLILLGGGGAVHVLASRRDYARAMLAAEDPRRLSAERRADERARALAIVARSPRRALELGVGRPDVEEAFDGGLVDVNHASATAIASLPGIDAALAAQIVDLRGATGFISLHDLDLVLDLDEATLQQLRELVVFIPRG